jgi:hypothetical protein
VDEPDQHPPGDQRRLPVDHRPEERKVRILRFERLRVVTRDRVIGETPYERPVAAGCRVLEGADPDMAGRDAREHRAGQQPVPRDVVAGRHDRERAGRRDAEPVHRLADHVLPQHRADRALPSSPRANGVRPKPFRCRSRRRPRMSRI